MSLRITVSTFMYFEDNRFLKDCIYIRDFINLHSITYSGEIIAWLLIYSCSYKCIPRMVRDVYFVQILTIVHAPSRLGKAMIWVI